MNESIYNLVPVEPEVVEKKPMYKSSHGGQTSVPGSTFGKITYFFSHLNFASCLPNLKILTWILQ